MPIQRIAKPGKPAASAAAAGDGEPVSLRPSDQQQGGLLDDVDVTFEDMSFVIWDYQGKSEKPALAVLGILVDSDGEKHEQYWSAGDASRFQPSEDGKTAVRVGSSGGGLTNSTNAAQLFKSIVDAGFPEDKITQSLECFEGMAAHVQRVAQPKRSGLPAQDGERERTVLVVTKINKMPWEKKPTGAAGKGKPAPAPAPGKGKAATAPVPASGDVSEEAAATLLAIIEGKESVKVSSLPVLSLKHLAGNANRFAILAMLKDGDFLASLAEAGTIQYDPDEGLVAPAE